MNINGWDYPFESLPNWDRRNTLYNAYGYDRLYENKQMNMAVLLYSVAEVSMCYCAGFLAIFRNKNAPKLVLQVKHSFYEKDVMFSSDAKYAFAIPGRYTQGIFIFDLEKETFAFFNIISSSIQMCVKEIGGNKFIITFDESQMRNSEKNKKLHGTKIDIDLLKWHPFKQIDSFCEKLECLNNGKVNYIS